MTDRFNAMYGRCFRFVMQAETIFASILRTLTMQTNLFWHTVATVKPGINSFCWPNTTKSVGRRNVSIMRVDRRDFISQIEFNRWLVIRWKAIRCGSIRIRWFDMPQVTVWNYHRAMIEIFTCQCVNRRIWIRNGHGKNGSTIQQSLLNKSFCCFCLLSFGVVLDDFIFQSELRSKLNSHSFCLCCFLCSTQSTHQTIPSTRYQADRDKRE